MSSQIKLGIYHHYKSKEKLYKVIGIARNAENNYEEVVVYQALYTIPEFGGESVMFVRPLSMFLENVVVDGNEIPRFEFVREN